MSATPTTRLPLVSMGEAASRLNMSRMTLWRRVRAGLVAVERVGGRWLVIEASLQAVPAAARVGRRAQRTRRRRAG